MKGLIMEQLRIDRRIEAILFASGAPVSCERLAQALGLTKGAVYQQLQLLEQQYDTQKTAWQLLRLEDSFQLCTRAEYAPDIKAALAITRNTAAIPSGDGGAGGHLLQSTGDQSVCGTGPRGGLLRGNELSGGKTPH